MQQQPWSRAVDGDGGGGRVFDDAHKSMLNQETCPAARGNVAARAHTSSFRLDDVTLPSRHVVALLGDPPHRDDKLSPSVRLSVCLTQGRIIET